MGNYKDNFKSNYSKKLLDPRWQQLRLRVFERDCWACQKCYSAEKTLHVHHKKYIKKHEPWEYDLDYLVTLCHECHEKEPSHYIEKKDILFEYISSLPLLSAQLRDLWKMLEMLDIDKFDNQVETIMFMLNSSEAFNEAKRVIDKVYEYDYIEANKNDKIKENS